MGGVADGGVLDGVVMLSAWVERVYAVFVAKTGRMLLCIQLV